MKTFQDFIKISESIEVIQLDEESEGSTTSADNIDIPDGKPIFKRDNFMGYPVVEVDDDTYTKNIKGKRPFSRWASFIEDEDLRSDMRKEFASNKKVLMRNSKCGTMAYIKA